ncbi:hypothetical protein [Streptomyces sp. NPDC051994]|uniref:hypothetical protein n=1 Tax=unclassified Streptomyces TaxID=2593676 RepID=UPI0034195254
MSGTHDKHREPNKGREAQEHHRPGDPAHPQPGKSSREQGQKETSRGSEDDLLREEDLHDETL